MELPKIESGLYDLLSSPVESVREIGILQLEANYPRQNDFSYKLSRIAANLYNGVPYYKYQYYSDDDNVKCEIRHKFYKSNYFRRGQFYKLNRASEKYWNWYNGIGDDSSIRTLLNDFSIEYNQLVVFTENSDALAVIFNANAETTKSNEMFLKVKDCKNFILSLDNFTSLKNAPDNVTDLKITLNLCESYEGCPHASRDVNLTGTIPSFHGIQNEIFGNFSIAHSDIFNFDGFPKKVHGDILASFSQFNGKDFPDPYHSININGMRGEEFLRSICDFRKFIFYDIYKPDDWDVHYG